jgi:uncharacterized protein (DUF2141 family)
MAINNNLFSLMLMAAFLKPPQIDATGEITVNVRRLESTKGKLMIKVFNSPDGFPREDKKAFKIFSFGIKDLDFQVVLNLPAGEYALAINHDVNGNGKVDTNFIGVPKEPLGLSNYPKPAMPNYEKAKFTVPPNAKISLTIPIDKVF